MNGSLEGAWRLGEDAGGLVGSALEPPGASVRDMRRPEKTNLENSGRTLILYLGRLGQVTVVADLGVHALEEGADDGGHGAHDGFRSEDIFIPLPVREAQ